MPSSSPHPTHIRLHRRFSSHPDQGSRPGKMPRHTPSAQGQELEPAPLPLTRIWPLAPSALRLSDTPANFPKRKRDQASPPLPLCLECLARRLHASSSVQSGRCSMSSPASSASSTSPSPSKTLPALSAWRRLSFTLAERITRGRRDMHHDAGRTLAATRSLCAARRGSETEDVLMLVRKFCMALG